MTLSIIGAGFGRTGTSSVKRALEFLGLGPCHHMSEVNERPRQKAIWREIAAGAEPDWRAVLAGYRAVIDWPAAHYWRHLSNRFPEARVLLTVRDPDEWYQSMVNTIIPAVMGSTDPDSLGVRLIAKQVFDGRITDRAHALACYQRNIEQVQETISAHRLLTYDVSTGWAPLCRFLDCTVPSVPFPHSNTRRDFSGPPGGP